ncbi:MAG: hypothetical protein AB7V50_09215 [Vampirovibrionia bacterium]
MTEKLILIEEILFKSFLIGVVFLLFSAVIYFGFSNQLIGLWSSMYNIDSKTASIIMISFMGLSKIILLFFFLVPALAVHWMRRTLKKAENK